MKQVYLLVICTLLLLTTACDDLFTSYDGYFSRSQESVHLEFVEIENVLHIKGYIPESLLQNNEQVLVILTEHNSFYGKKKNEFSLNSRDIPYDTTFIIPINRETKKNMFSSLNDNMYLFFAVGNEHVAQVSNIIQFQNELIPVTTPISVPCETELQGNDNIIITENRPTSWTSDLFLSNYNRIFNHNTNSYLFYTSVQYNAIYDNTLYLNFNFAGPITAGEYTIVNSASQLTSETVEVYTTTAAGAYYGRNYFFPGSTVYVSENGFNYILSFCDMQININNTDVSLTGRFTFE